MPRGILTKKQLTMNHTFFTRDINEEGTATDIPFNVELYVLSPNENYPYERELYTLLTQGKIIAYGYTTLQPY